jgi:hypothetical protein
VALGRGSRIGLKVTEAGLNAIGVPALPEQPTADTRTSRVERKERPAKKPGRASGARDSAESVLAGAGPDQVVAAAAKPGSKLGAAHRAAWPGLEVSTSAIW